jgi:hypothetical protein
MAVNQLDDPPCFAVRTDREASARHEPESSHQAVDQAHGEHCEEPEIRPIARKIWMF